MLFMDRVPDFEALLSRIQSPALLALAQHWNAARGKKRMPCWAELSLGDSAPYAKLLWGFAYDPKSQMFTGCLVGAKASRWFGETFCGARLDEVHAPVNFGEAQRILTQSVTTPSAARFSGRLFKSDNFVVSGERLLLPVAENGVMGDGILGASDYAPPPLLGRLEMIHENEEWYAI